MKTANLRYDGSSIVLQSFQTIFRIAGAPLGSLGLSFPTTFDGAPLYERSFFRTSLPPNPICLNGSIDLSRFTPRLCA